MDFFEINNETYACKIHQRKKGLPYLLMLHGFMCDYRVFNHLMDDLSKFCNTVTVDLLGFGASSKPENPDRYNEHHQVEDISQLVQQLNITPLFLFGYSMGGRLALKTALSVPQMFKGLILESTTCGIRSEREREERQKADERRAREIEKNFENFLSKWHELELFQPPLPVNRKIAEKYRDIQSEQNQKSVAASLRGFGTGSTTPVCDQLKNVDLKVLLMAGSEDQKYQRINNFMAKQFPNATFSSIRAGHRIHLDNPDTFVQSIRNYLANS